jgi:hypothetical protein
VLVVWLRGLFYVLKFSLSLGVRALSLYVEREFPGLGSRLSSLAVHRE